MSKKTAKPKTKAKPPTKAKAKPATPTKKLSPMEQLKQQVKKLQDELAAHRKRVDTEHSLSSQVRKRERELEAAKSVVGGCKQALADAIKELTDFLTGGVQTSHPDLQPPPALPPKEEPAAPSTEPSRYNLPVDQRIDVMDAPEVYASKVIAKIMQADKPTKIDKKAVVEVMGLPYLVRQGYPEEKPTRFFLQSLKTKDEWAQLCEADFGRCVNGFDQSEEAKNQRQLGGEDCGRVVVVGQKKFVLGPERFGLVLVCEAAEKAAEIEAKKIAFPVSGKDAAAGEREPESLGPADVAPPDADEDEDEDVNGNEAAGD